MKMLYKMVPIEKSSKIILTDKKFDQEFEENIVREKLPHLDQTDIYFINKKNKYIWDESIQMFRKLRNIDESLNQSDFFKMQGLTGAEVREKLRVSGLLHNFCFCSERNIICVLLY